MERIGLGGRGSGRDQRQIGSVVFYLREAA
jgi:hypothetical protein